MSGLQSKRRWLGNPLLLIAICLLLILGLGLILYIIGYSDTINKIISDLEAKVPSWIIQIPLFAIFIYMFARLFAKDLLKRLSFHALVLKTLAYGLVVTPAFILILLFYLSNQAGVPTLIQVAANSFLGAFVVLNVIHWLISMREDRDA